MCSVICWMDFFPPSNDKSMQAPRAPLDANAVRNSLPNPLAAPVTRHVLPSNENAPSVIRLRLGRAHAAVLRAKLRRRLRGVVERNRFDIEWIWRRLCTMNKGLLADYTFSRYALVFSNSNSYHFAVPSSFPRETGQMRGKAASS